MGKKEVTLDSFGHDFLLHVMAHRLFTVVALQSYNILALTY